MGLCSDRGHETLNTLHDRAATFSRASTGAVLAVLVFAEVIGGGCARVDAGAGPGRGDAGIDASPVDRPATPDGFITADLSPGAGEDAACAVQSAMAETLPLDLFVMMDSSGSMLERTAAGTTKWDAVKAALATFFRDPQSVGMGIGLQYFPLFQPNVPSTCDTDDMCGSFGPCDKLRVCLGSGSTMARFCTTANDCQLGERCVLLGTCSSTGNGCAPVGTLCQSQTELCTEYQGSCRNRDRCDQPAYAASAVAVAALPGAATALVSSLDMRQPDGLTPTAPAVAGALQAAQQYARAKSGHKVAVLLVTDGLPTECPPTEIPQIAAGAAAAAAGTPGIPTFVIGVFGAEQVAAAATNLNALAAAGGTGTAVVIDTNQNVTQVLQAALNQIRGKAVACEYKIPVANVGGGGAAIDFQKVNVQFRDGAGVETTVGYVNSRAACDPTRGGWYYDVVPAVGQSPQSITMCDATCSTLRAGGSVRVDIVLGCRTVIIT